MKTPNLFLLCSLQALLTLLFVFNFESASVWAQGPKTSVAYERKEWPHWVDSDRDCLNTRHEILNARSLRPPVLSKAGCTVLSGEWEDYYYPEKLYEAKKIDIDHLVPLKNAALSGGNRWSRLKKQQFANDPENLVVTALSYNRSKGPKGIDEWLPLNRSRACRYLQDWIRIKTKYQLQLLAAEQEAINSLTPACRRLGVALIY